MVALHGQPAGTVAVCKTSHVPPVLLWCVMGVLAIVAVGGAAALFPAAAGRLSAHPLLASAAQRFALVRDDLVDRLGAGGAFAALICAGIPPLVLPCWFLGMLGFHPPLRQANTALFEWFLRSSETLPAMTTVARLVTQIVEWPETFAISGLAAAVLAFTARRRRWLPPLLITTAVVAERYLQKVITEIVDEPAPPTALGVYPSGGAARVIAIYGFLAYLALAQRPGPRRPLVVTVWTGIALLAFAVGYARAHLLLHWPIDIPGGWLFGALLLTLLIAASSVFRVAVDTEDEPREGLRSQPHSLNVE